MTTITTLSDVRVWAQNQGGLTSAEVQTLVDAIHNDGDGQRPAWGRDWSDYLDRIDVTQTVLHQEVVFGVTAPRPVKLTAAQRHAWRVRGWEKNDIWSTPTHTSYFSDETQARAYYEVLVLKHGFKQLQRRTRSLRALYLTVEFEPNPGRVTQAGRAALEAAKEEK